MTDAAVPEPEEYSSRPPPPRLPPTAIGSATPPPPRRYGRIAAAVLALHRRVHRVMIAIHTGALGALMFGGAALLWWKAPLGRLLGLGLLAAGTVQSLVLLYLWLGLIADHRRTHRRLRQPG